MGHSQVEKARSRERILAEASRQIRREGLESVGVGALMKSVGLTHGGFYGHFENRSALLHEALQRALLEGEAAAKSQVPHQQFAGILRSYLSRAHRDARDGGCAMAALVSDVARAETASREVMSERIEAFVSTVAESLNGDREGAIVAVSAMIGALALSRVLVDPARSDVFLKAVREHLMSLEPGEPESSTGA